MEEETDDFDKTLIWSTEDETAGEERPDEDFSSNILPDNKCIDFLADGITPCKNSKKIGNICLVHHKKRERLKNLQNDKCTDFLADGITPCKNLKKVGNICLMHHKKQERLKNESENENSFNTISNDEDNKCIDFLADGITPCKNLKKIGNICLVHHKKSRNRMEQLKKLYGNTIAPEKDKDIKVPLYQNKKETSITTNEVKLEGNVSETEENVSETEEIETEEIEKKNIKYFLNIGRYFRIGLEEPFDKLIVEKDENTVYTEEDLEHDYRSNTIESNNIVESNLDNVPKLFKYKGKGKIKYRYFIALKYNNRNLIFLPYGLKSVIQSFACIFLEKFSLVSDLRFYCNNNGLGYPVSDHLSLHEAIYGKKAEKGGWYFVEKTRKNSKIEAIWITMISGRSINQYDPDPSNRNFYYYHNDENGCNIKVPEPLNFIEGFDAIPKITEGNPGDFYKDDKGKIYIKVDEHRIDHIDSVPSDCRTHKLREIACTTNSANRKKSEKKYTGCQSYENEIKPYRGCIVFRTRSYERSFKTEIEAARFYDYYAFALHGVFIRNNNTLTLEEQNELLLYGIEKIPTKYLVLEKNKNDYPGLRKISNSKYIVDRVYKELKIRKTYNTYEEAFKSWTKFQNKIQTMIKNERELTLKLNQKNFDSEYGYLVIEDTKENRTVRVKLNIEAYLEFVHCTWRIDLGKPNGVYKGKSKDLHVHTMKFYNEDYNRREFGSVDHINQNFFDCTIESLRAASQSLQIQNTKRKNVLNYTGVGITGKYFTANYKDKHKTGFKYIEDAARMYNSLVLDDFGEDEEGNSIGRLNNVPDGKKTSVKDLYSCEKLTYDMLKNITVTEMRSIATLSKQLKLHLKIGQVSKITKKNYEEVRDKTIEFCIISKIF
jgi:hypothetical protein